MNDPKYYQLIWQYLSLGLEPKEEAQLMSWLDLSTRNEDYFNQVVKDFNQMNAIKADEETKSVSFYSRKRRINYSIAAVISLLIISSLLIFLVNYKYSKLETLYLIDGAKIAYQKDTNIDYNPIRYHNTGIIKVNGAAWFQVAENSKSLLTIETTNGYFLLEDAEGYIESNNEGESTIQLLKGSAQFISKSRPSQAIGINSGDQLSYFENYNAFILTHSFAIKTPI